jgi:predicted TIM-barrel enzyme
MLDAWKPVSARRDRHAASAGVAGAPNYADDLAGSRPRCCATQSARRGGVHGLMLENFGDTPFLKSRVPQHVVAHMTAIACAITRGSTRPRDQLFAQRRCAALSVAHASVAAFVRVNVLCGARVTDQGVIEGIAADCCACVTCSAQSGSRSWPTWT